MPNIEQNHVANEFYQALLQFLKMLDEVHTRRLTLPDETRVNVENAVKALITFLNSSAMGQVNPGSFRLKQIKTLSQELSVRFIEKSTPQQISLSGLIGTEIISSFLDDQQLAAMSTYTEKLNNAHHELDKPVMIGICLEKMQQCHKNLVELKYMTDMMFKSNSVGKTKEYMSKIEQKLDLFKKTLTTAPIEDLEKIIENLDKTLSNHASIMKKLRLEETQNDNELKALKAKCEEENDNLKKLGLQPHREPAIYPQISLAAIKEQFQEFTKNYEKEVSVFLTRTCETIENDRSTYIKTLDSLKKRIFRTTDLEEEYKTAMQNKIDTLIKKLSIPNENLVLSPPYSADKINQFLSAKEQFYQSLNEFNPKMDFKKQWQNAKEQDIYKRVTGFLEDIKNEYERLHGAQDIPDIKTYKSENSTTDDRIPQLAQLYQSFNTLRQDHYVNEIVNQKSDDNKIKEISTAFEEKIKDTVNKMVKEPTMYFVGNVNGSTLREGIISFLQKWFGSLFERGLIFFGTRTTRLARDALNKLTQKEDEPPPDENPRTP